jgi:diketogulonate reductase-like aldo/keto reductase
MIVVMTERIGRRSLIKGIAGLAGMCGLPGMLFADNHNNVSTRRIKSSGLDIPVIGLGSWLTFDAGAARSRRENVKQIMQAFFDRGGRMIDSSPMYSTAQEVIGASLEQIENDGSLFSATKVWIPGRSTGIWQMEGALDLWSLK